jgi:hypothetical protein
MRRLLALGCVTMLLGLLFAVAPAIVRPEANRAEAVLRCDLGTGSVQTIARRGPWAAKVLLCVEALGNGVRPGARVWCGTASTQVPCNWDFNPFQLIDETRLVEYEERANEQGKTNGAYIATPHWASRSVCIHAESNAFVKVRFPDGVLSSLHYVTWIGVLASCR